MIEGDAAVAIAQHLVFERVQRKKSFPFLFEVGYALLEVGSVDVNRKVQVAFVADEEHHRQDLLVEGFEIEIFDDAD